VHGYVYPNSGDDSAFHLAYFDGIQKDGEILSPNYFGQDIVGYPLVWVSDVSGVSIDILFLWFNFLVLWLVGISVFILVAKFVNWKAGLLAIPMVMFMSPSTLNLYDTGAIFDLMSVGVILPLGLFCGMQLWVTRKWYWLFPFSLFVVLGVAVHTIILLAVIQSGKVIEEVTLPILMGSWGIILGYAVIVMFVISIVFWVCKYNELKIDRNAKILSYCLFGIVMVLVMLITTEVLGWTLRIALNLAIVLPMLVACLWGVIINTIRNNRLVLCFVCLFVIIASLPIMMQYMQYNNAINPLDMKVIAYVNDLDGEYYSCSPEVAPWVYGRFMDKEYKESALPHIVRNQPMTSRTTPGTSAYWWEHRTAGYWRDYEIDYVEPNGRITEFKDGELEIYVVADK